MLTIADGSTLHFNGHQIELLRFPGAHTDGDLAVFFPDINVLHTGDLYLSNGFPPAADAFHGGTFDGVVAALDALADLIDDETQVVPGHGPVSNLQELRDYRKMIVKGRDRVAALTKEGKTLEEVIDADPTAGLYTDGESWLPRSMFVRLVYAELAWPDTAADSQEEIPKN